MMTTPRFADLGRSRSGDARASGRADANSPQQDETTTGEQPDHEKDDEMSDIDKNSKDYLAGQAAGETIGFKAANDRMNAVFASEHYAGREKVAAKMLNKGGMSAEDIIDVLADTPKVEQQAGAGTTTLSAEEQRRAAEEGGRREMQEQLNTTNADLGAGQDDTRSASAKADDVWDRARERNAKKGD